MGLRENEALYGDLSVAARYLGSAPLYPAEQWIFREYAAAFSGRVLDVGMGGGRTTGPLLACARQYTGVDLSPSMVAVAHQHFPTADLRVMDMRRLPEVFAGERFEAILIAFNSIDYIGWEDRNRLLAGLLGLLSEGGLLAFSTHSLDWQDGRPRRFEVPESARFSLQNLRSGGVEWAKVPLRRLRWLLRAYPNFLRNRRLESHHVGYACINDMALYYGLVTVYVSEGRQRQVLEDVGYEVLRTMAPDLKSVGGVWNYFVCRRPGDAASARL